jgi:hypothetical protein
MVDIRITDEEISEWKAEIADIDDQILLLQSRKGGLSKKLELVELITKDAPSGPELPIQENLSTESGAKKPAIVLSILRESGGYMSPLQIKEVLKSRGEKEKEWQPKYIYVHQVLSRLVLQGKVIKGKTNHKYKIASAI